MLNNVAVRAYILLNRGLLGTLSRCNRMWSAEAEIEQERDLRSEYSSDPVTPTAHRPCPLLVCVDIIGSSQKYTVQRHQHIDIRFHKYDLSRIRRNSSIYVSAKSQTFTSSRPTSVLGKKRIELIKDDATYIRRSTHPSAVYSSHVLSRLLDIASMFWLGG